MLIYHQAIFAPLNRLPLTFAEFRYTSLTTSLYFHMLEFSLYLIRFLSVLPVPNKRENNGKRDCQSRDFGEPEQDFGQTRTGSSGSKKAKKCWPRKKSHCWDKQQKAKYVSRFFRTTIYNLFWGIAPNQPIFKYAVEVNFVYQKPDGTECTIEMSKSTKKGTEHDYDKIKCQKVYEEAVGRYEALRKGGPFFYDRQASLYTLTKLQLEVVEINKNSYISSLQNIAFDVTQGISKRPNFKKAQFILKKVDESYQSTSNVIKKTVNPCPANADRTLLEAMNMVVSGPAFEKWELILIFSQNRQFSARTSSLSVHVFTTSSIWRTLSMKIW